MALQPPGNQCLEKCGTLADAVFGIDTIALSDRVKPLLRRIRRARLAAELRGDRREGRLVCAAHAHPPSRVHALYTQPTLRKRQFACLVFVAGEI